MTKPDHPTAAFEDAMLALYLRAEEELQTCIVNFFSDDPDRLTKMAAARGRCDTARDDWIICRDLRNLKPSQPRDWP